MWWNEGWNDDDGSVRNLHNLHWNEFCSCKILTKINHQKLGSFFWCWVLALFGLFVERRAFLSLLSWHDSRYSFCSSEFILPSSIPPLLPLLCALVWLGNFQNHGWWWWWWWCIDLGFFSSVECEALFLNWFCFFFFVDHSYCMLLELCNCFFFFFTLLFRIWVLLLYCCTSPVLFSSTSSSWLVHIAQFLSIFTANFITPFTFLSFSFF